MKNSYLKILPLFFILGCQRKLDDDRSKASYALGRQQGMSLKSQNRDLDIEIYAKSLADAYSGKEPLLPIDEQTKALMKQEEKNMDQKRLEAEKRQDSFSQENYQSLFHPLGKICNEPSLYLEKTVRRRFP